MIYAAEVDLAQGYAVELYDDVMHSVGHALQRDLKRSLPNSCGVQMRDLQRLTHCQPVVLTASFTACIPAICCWRSSGVCVALAPATLSSLICSEMGETLIVPTVGQPR